MLSREDLQAISTLLDQKLEPMQQRMDGMQQQMDGMQQQMDGMQQQMDGMQKDIADLKEDVAQLREESAITRAGVEQLVRWANDPNAQTGRMTLDDWDRQRRVQGTA